MKVFILLLVLFTAQTYGNTIQPTATPTSFFFYLDPLPATTCELNQTLVWHGPAYYNITTRVTNTTTGEYRSYFNFSSTSYVDISIELYPYVVNEISVTTCTDYFPIVCQTRSSENTNGLSVDTTECNYSPTLTPFGIGVALLLVSGLLIWKRRER